VSPAVKYTLARIGLFVAVLLVLLPLRLNIFVTLMIAVLASAGFALVLLRPWRDQMAQQLAGAAERRRADKERLRAALAGDDEPSPPEPPAEPPADEPRAEPRADEPRADEPRADEPRADDSDHDGPAR
jgi:hypothetical protein